MRVDLLYLGGLTWLDTPTAAALLGVAPHSLTTNRTRGDLAMIQSTVYNGLRLWSAVDVLMCLESRAAKRDTPETIETLSI